MIFIAAKDVLSEKIIALIVCTVLIISSLSLSVFAEDEIKVVIDGEELEMDVSPAIINGRTMVPLRAIFEYFGAKIDWWQDTKRIYAYLGSVCISMSVENEL